MSGKSTLARALFHCGAVDRVVEGPSSALRSAIRVDPAKRSPDNYLSDNIGWGAAQLGVDGSCLVRYYWSTVAYGWLDDPAWLDSRSLQALAALCRQPSGWILLECSHEVLCDRLRTRDPDSLSSADQKLLHRDVYDDLLSAFREIAAAAAPVLILNTSDMTARESAKIASKWLSSL